MGTLFSIVYNRFLGKVTDDMYVELTPQDTLRDLQNLLIDAIPGFEFPRVNLYDYTITESKTIIEDPADISLAGEDRFITVINGGKADGIEEDVNYILIDESRFNIDLTEEEINILAILMMRSWLQRQITSIENIRMKYSGSDFKFTSQANHLSKLLSLLNECNRQSHHDQRLYKRRKLNSEGKYESTWKVFASQYGQQ